MNTNDLQEHIRINKPDYNTQIIIAALYFELFGVIPKIGLSGGQAECIKELIEAMPRKEGQPLLGLATTGQLLAEIKARVEIDGKLEYRPVDNN